MPFFKEKVPYIKDFCNINITSALAEDFPMEPNSLNSK